MHLVLELHKYLLMVEEGVREQSVEPADYGEKQFGACRRDRDSTVEVLGVVDGRCGMVQRVDHIVDGRALLGVLMRGAEVEPLICRLHLRADLGGADTLQLDN